MNRSDRGLQAVTRVRAVRERDSKQGLQRAGQIVDERLIVLEHRLQQLAGAPVFTDGSGAGFLTARGHLTCLADAATQASDDVDLGRTVAAEALGRWQHERTRLRAVELLADRRAQRLREDSMRAEGRTLDEVAGRNWLRTQPVQERP